MPESFQTSEETDSPMGRERRRFPRTRVESLPLQLDGGAPLRVRDLSRAGVCVFSEEPLRMMTHVGFRFETPDGETIQGEGVVVRCERLSPALGHYEVAIYFQELAPGSEERLVAFLAGLGQGS